MTEEITKRDLTFFLHMLKIGQQGIFRDLETQHHMIIMMLCEPGISAVTGVPMLPWAELKHYRIFVVILLLLFEAIS